VTHFQKLTDRTSQGTNVVVHCSIWEEVPIQTQILNVISFSMCLEPRLTLKKKLILLRKNRIAKAMEGLSASLSSQLLLSNTVCSRKEGTFELDLDDSVVPLSCY